MPPHHHFVDRALGLAALDLMAGQRAAECTEHGGEPASIAVPGLAAEQRADHAASNRARRPRRGACIDRPNGFDDAAGIAGRRDGWGG